jgi:hypothetical protein
MVGASYRTESQNAPAAPVERAACVRGIRSRPEQSAIVRRNPRRELGYRAGPVGDSSVFVILWPSVRIGRSLVPVPLDGNSNCSHDAKRDYGNGFHAAHPTMPGSERKKAPHNAARVRRVRRHLDRSLLVRRDTVRPIRD